MDCCIRSALVYMIGGVFSFRYAVAMGLINGNCLKRGEEE